MRRIGMFTSKTKLVIKKNWLLELLEGIEKGQAEIHTLILHEGNKPQIYIGHNTKNEAHTQKSL